MLPAYSSSKIFKSSSLSQCFFYKKTKAGGLCDFKAPLSDELALSIINEFGLDKLLVLNQNHTKHVVCYPSTKGYHFADGIMTSEKKVGLLIRHADCQAAFFYDPVKNVIAAVHAGFKGQVQRIYSETIHSLMTHYGSHASDLLVAISPSLGLDHAEFINYQNEFPSHLHKFMFDGHMDLKVMALDELLGMGVLEKNIDIDDRCTHCDDELFFSYRKNKTESRLGSLIFLK